MARNLAASFSVRARWGIVAPVALLLLCQTGCRQNRTSMRPVYLTAPLTPVTTGPSMLEPSTPSFSDSIESDSLAPSSAPSLPDEVRPKATPIPREPRGNDEPPLKSIESETGPGLTRPSASRTAPKARLASVRGDVREYLANPDDLFLPPKADKPWKYVVVHHSAHAEGGYAQIDREHRKALGIDGCGYHFVIGNGSESPDGQIEVARRWTNQKAGVHCRDAKNPDANEYGIGICLVGDLNQEPPTAKQVEAARALVSYLEERYRITPDRVDTHDHVASGPTTCPGELFPRETILNGKPKSRNVASRFAVER